MLYVLLGAIAVGLSLGIFGSGGSILTVPILVYLLGHPDKIAIAESLGIVGSIALLGAIPYARDGKVDWRAAVLFGIPGMAGAYGGAWLSTLVPGRVQLAIFGLVMAFAAWRMWNRSAAPGAGSESDHTPVRPPFLPTVTQGVGVGALTGFVGVGGGFLIVPALALVVGLPMCKAVATSLIVIAMNSATGLLKHAHHLLGAGADPHWTVMAVFIAVGAAGAFVGRAFQSRFDHRALQRAFAVFLLCMAAFILGRELLKPHRATAAASVPPSTSP